nr:hypothetical protein [Candidatus Sigynarchaeota archaeon]
MARLEWVPRLSDEMVRFTWPEIMVKLVGTIDPAGYPHVTLIVCNKAISPGVVKWGMFMQGRSKKHVLSDPKQAAFFMGSTMPYMFMQVKMALDHCSVEGEDAADFNSTNLLRYNTYVRVERVFFNTIVASSPVRPLPVGGIVKGMLDCAIGLGGLRTGAVEARVHPFGNELFGAPANPKFMAFIDEADGYPVILPCLQARVLDGKSIAFPLSQFKDELSGFKPSQKIACFALSMELMSLLVKGSFVGYTKSRGITFGIVDVEEVYNSMPPTHAILYPKLETRPKITSFSL